MDYFGSSNEEDDVVVEKQPESQPYHSFSDGIGFYFGQTFDSKQNLKLLLDQASVKKSFCFNMLKSCSKYYKGECKSEHYSWMLRASKYANSNVYNIYKYVLH